MLRLHWRLALKSPIAVVVAAVVVAETSCRHRPSLKPDGLEPPRSARRRRRIAWASALAGRISARARAPGARPAFPERRCSASVRSTDRSWPASRWCGESWRRASRCLCLGRRLGQHLERRRHRLHVLGHDVGEVSPHPDPLREQGIDHPPVAFDVAPHDVEQVVDAAPERPGRDDFLVPAVISKDWKLSGRWLSNSTVTKTTTCGASRASAMSAW